jgi:adenylate cyclase
MRVTAQGAPAEDLDKAPLRDNAKPGRHQPSLRLIQAETANQDIASARLAVILIADAVAYTRHMAADEAGTYARLTAIHRTIIAPGIARHSARIIKNTGDGFLAEFGSATRAVWFAVEFQDAVRSRNARRTLDRRLEFRVGINLCDVIVAADDVFGHIVNVAARLEANAEPGGVLVSHAVFTSVRDPRLWFDDAGDLSLGAMNETVRGFRVGAGAARRSRRSRHHEGRNVMDG